jgi:hypothetical protein
MAAQAKDVIARNHVSATDQFGRRLPCADGRRPRVPDSMFLSSAGTKGPSAPIVSWIPTTNSYFLTAVFHGSLELDLPQPEPAPTLVAFQNT